MVEILLLYFALPLLLPFWVFLLGAAPVPHGWAAPTRSTGLLPSGALADAGQWVVALYQLLQDPP